jgi:hypothetical protein
VAVLVLLVGAVGAHAKLVPCRRAGDAGQIADALGRIRRSVDPCGESAQIRALLHELERCTRARYEICTDTTATRNLFDRAGKDGLGTITWNPELRSELEPGCGDDPAGHVMRDPVASLLHEIVHAAHDCEGLDPAEHELDAVRVENIYRRAAGLCPRSGYGDDRLPTEVMNGCAARGSVPRETRRATTADRQAADSERRPGEISPDPARSFLK